MRVLLIDDHALFAQGLTFLLAELDPKVECTVATSVSEGLAAPGPFDLVLLDFHLTDVTRLDALAQVREALEGVPVAILSGEEKLDVVRDTIEAGAMGFIPKSSTLPVLLAALRLILAGGCYLPPQVLTMLQAPRADAAPPCGTEPCPALSERQRMVLLKAIRGKSNKVIARETALSEGTIKAHLSAAFRVLGVNNRTEALFKAARMGMTADTEGEGDGDGDADDAGNAHDKAPPPN